MALSAESETLKVLTLMRKWIASRIPEASEEKTKLFTLETLEAMLAQGWVVGA